ncbi:hypothetical protein KY290_036239 [Solanum tuberosum]|uniref:Uncharacterized protein n=1 Tax=Solanum tuberosum TaxID=4113 RepID=A0ABQ7TTF5_SOLTU|nr:hypothetical protein KY290_036239 [Solanum tuberosum]
MIADHSEKDIHECEGDPCKCGGMGPHAFAIVAIGLAITPLREAKHRERGPRAHKRDEQIKLYQLMHIS